MVRTLAALIFSLLNLNAYAASCDLLLTGPDRTHAISAIEKGLSLYRDRSAYLPKPVLVHGTSTEVVERSFVDGGFVGAPAIKDTELTDHWDEIGNKKVIFFHKFPDSVSVGRAVDWGDHYAEIAGLEHFILAQTGHGLEAANLLPAADLWDLNFSELSSLPEFSREAFLHKLIAEFGPARLDALVRAGRSRGGVVLTLKNLGRKNVMDSPSTVDDHVLLLQRPLPFAKVDAIIPTNAASAARMEALNSRLKTGTK